MLTWETTQSGIVRFSLKCDMATHSIWRSAGTLEPSVFLFYTILSALVYRSVKPVALIAYSKKVHQYHDWLLDRDGASIFYFDKEIEGGVAPISFMSACDTASCLDSEIAVHFGAHPTLTRVVYL